jgi:hypothetical protein
MTMIKWLKSLFARPEPELFVIETPYMRMFNCDAAGVKQWASMQHGPYAPPFTVRKQLPSEVR